MKKMFFLSFTLSCVFVFSSFIGGDDRTGKEDSNKHVCHSDCPGEEEINHFVPNDCYELSRGMIDGKCVCGGNLKLNYKVFIKWVPCPLKCENGRIKVNGKYEKCTGCTPRQDGDGHGKVRHYEPRYVCESCGKKYTTY